MEGQCYKVITFFFANKIQSPLLTPLNKIQQNQLRSKVTPLSTSTGMKFNFSTNLSVKARLHWWTNTRKKIKSQTLQLLHGTESGTIANLPM